MYMYILSISMITRIVYEVTFICLLFYRLDVSVQYNIFYLCAVLYIIGK